MVTQCELAMIDETIDIIQYLSHSHTAARSSGSLSTHCQAQRSGREPAEQGHKSMTSGSTTNADVRPIERRFACSFAEHQLERATAHRSDSSSNIVVPHSPLHTRIPARLAVQGSRTISAAAAPTVAAPTVHPAAPVP